MSSVPVPSDSTPDIQGHRATELDQTTAVDAHLDALTKRQRAFVRQMVWYGQSLRKAAAELGIPDRTAYHWIRAVAIKRAIAAEEQVLRSSARAGNIHALMRVRDESKNHLAVVQAVKALEDLTNSEAQSGGITPTKGYVIVLPAPGQTGHSASPSDYGQGQPVDNPRIIDITPTHEPAHGADDTQD